MSTATDFLNNVPGPPTPEEISQSSGRFDSLVENVTHFAPAHDWISFIIMLWMMANVGWSVMLAGWGDLPSVVPTLLFGTIAAFMVSKRNFNWYLTVIYALGFGFFIVFWQGTSQAVGADPVTRSIDGFSRFSLWVETAQSGGISTDTVPFAMMFMTASWIVGYGVTAITFRFRSPWLPTVLMSLVILTNLSYRHGEHEHTYFLFLVGGIALFAHLTTVRRIERWKSEGIAYSRHLAWATVQDGLLFALPIVLLSALLPIWEPRSEQVHDAWDIFRAPFYALQDPANRLLAGIDGPGSNQLFSTPSSSMAFGGSIELTDEPLMWIRSKYRVPYAGRVYQRYTSEGWLSDASTKIEAQPRAALTLAPTELERERVSNVYVPLVDTKTVVPAGGVFSVDRESVAHVLNPLQWNIPLTGSVAGMTELPSDLRDLGFALRFALNDLVPSDSFRPAQLRSQRLAQPELVAEMILALQKADTTGEAVVVTREEVNESGGTDKYETVVLPLSSDSRTIEWDGLTIDMRIDNEFGFVNQLEVERDSPIEQVGVQLASEISKKDIFSIQTFVSLATDEQLNEAGTDYPTWVTDRYLPLPSTLPSDVGELASAIVRGANAVTPFEKAEAVKAFLRNQEYSLEIAGPEFGVDGIYYFLFQTQDESCSSVDPNCDESKVKGYSQYFGSSAAVLLRSVGVPARFIAGWASGEYVPDSGMFLIRDKDRHGWTQIYFPKYGWIDYEVTPGQEAISRGLLAPSLTDGDPFSAGAVGSAEEDPDFLQDIADLERFAREARLENGAFRIPDGDSATEEFVFPWRPLAWVGGGVMAIGFVVFLWWLSLRGMDAPTRAYARMNRIASFLGMKRQSPQTALEFATSLGEQTIAASEPALFIAIEYQRKMYAGTSSTGDDDEIALRVKKLNQAWRRVARALIARRIRQLGGLGPELGKGRSV
ncbi:MAG: transglutaminase-like domain-containing protein [Dehalococcoidia bacterium]|jgi:transglutaminase-like putative cysteine protease|nr:transglutaminase-like domain-containing protein [Dehalococcoidia bacterium]MDP7485219.1 transglutaminase-like domain-containing protein [Dehalococcoidia bacterium]|tara:strand:- start:5442 stop:8261 length:2820 start_codon:yes stop_codon:yes gene_type:complete